MSLYLQSNITDRPNLFNQFYSVDWNRGSKTDTPITLQNVKDHIYITFTDDDTYLSALLDQSIEAIERFTATAIYGKTITLIADIIEEFELPYCPLTTFTSASQKTGVSVYTPMVSGSDYEIDSTLQFARFIPYTLGRFKMVYDVGGGTIPAGLKLAILNEVSFRYENRGDGTNRYANQNVGISEGAQALATPYRRLQWL